MPHNRGTRHKPKWAGHVSYKGRRKWVGAQSMEEFRIAEARGPRNCASKLIILRPPQRRRESLPCLSSLAPRFTTMAESRWTWPDGERAQKETGRRDSSVRYLREGLRPFIREFHDRPLDSFSRNEALTWILPKGANVQQSVRQFFNHALERDLIPRNQFIRPGVSKRKRRVDRPDFEIITDEQYERLRRCARESRTDDYGLVLEGRSSRLVTRRCVPAKSLRCTAPIFTLKRT